MTEFKAIAFGFAAVLLTGAVAAQEAAPDITGKWTGTYTGGVRGGGGELHEAYDPPRFVEAGDITFTLMIDEQKGRGFVGSLGADFGTQALQGVIRLDNKTLLIVDEDTSLTATLLSSDQMEFCAHSQNPSERLTTCLSLTRE
ncbi:MAG: hypothetical protein GY798_24690 [Hyphomicrobiales bacterium]|nr:hypothetical protein [Hyphomicrobiales bacterium]